MYRYPAPIHSNNDSDGYCTIIIIMLYSITYLHVQKLKERQQISWLDDIMLGIAFL